jgi:hypothetical protein
MLNNSIKRESTKAVGVGAAALVGGPVAAILAASLGVAVEALGYLGEKRTKELFDAPIFLDTVVAEIKKSDDFASFVYDIWMKHNFESSETRRKRLKAILTHAVGSENKDFENFTRLITAAQQIDDMQLRVLAEYYENMNAEDEPEDNGAGRLDGLSVKEYKINSIRFAEALQKRGIAYSDSLTSILNQLCYLGLISMYVAMDGEYYMPTALGKIFLEYVRN